jgi:pimeloyl-ACP methyl ester carboxylesterase
MGTLGKAAGGAGAFVAGAENAVEWILQKARTYIFSTAEPALIAHALLTAIDLIEQGDMRARENLAARIAQLRATLKPKRWTLLPSHGHPAPGDRRKRRNHGGRRAALRARPLGAGHPPAHRAGRLGAAAHHALRRAHRKRRCEVPGIGAPALVIHGDCDNVVPAAAGRWLADTLPNARLHRFEACAHLPFLSRPEACAALVRQFAGEALPAA